MNFTCLEKIEKICRIITNLAEINTTFVNKTYDPILSFTMNEIPILITEYFKESLASVYDNTVKTQLNNVTVLTLPQRLSYISMPIYAEKAGFEGCIILGPFLLEEPNNLLIKDLMYKLNIPIPLQNTLKQYYDACSIFDNYKVDNLAECLFSLVANITSDHVTNIEIKRIEIQRPNKLNIHLGQTKLNKDEYIEVIERRYQNERDLLRAVGRGDFSSAKKFMGKGGFDFKFQDRVPHDPLRSYKNISFVFNTLLRKAAESGGVHPIYTDELSTKYAVLIEKLNNVNETSNLNLKMVQEYCSLVTQLSTGKYSSIIRKIIEYIRINIDTDLNLEILSQIMNASPTAISRSFKKETGTSITQYINELRVKEAINLMDDDRYNITEIAFKVGFNDTNYFTKVFKKITGVTPSEFKKNNNDSDQ